MTNIIPEISLNYEQLFPLSLALPIFPATPLGVFAVSQRCWVISVLRHPTNLDNRQGEGGDVFGLTALSGSISVSIENEILHESAVKPKPKLHALGGNNEWCITYHSANILEYANVLSETGDMKYIGTVLRPQLSK